MIEVLFWDVDGTLLDFIAAEKNAIKKLFEKFGFGACSDEAVAEYSRINKKYWSKIEKGEIKKEKALVERFRDFFSLLHLPLSKAEEFNAEYQVTLGDTVKYCENSLEIVKSLRGRVKQYAASNGTVAAQTKKLKTSGFGELLDGVFLSEETGAEKPDLKFFEAAFERLKQDGVKIDQSKMMIVGDSLSSDIAGGRNAQIKTCWYHPELDFSANKENEDLYRKKIWEETDLNQKLKEIPPDYIIKSLNEIYELIEKA